MIPDDDDAEGMMRFNAQIKLANWFGVFFEAWPGAWFRGTWREQMQWTLDRVRETVAVHSEVLDD